MTDHTPPTDQELDEIEARANAATPGPWTVDSSIPYGHRVGSSDEADWVAWTGEHGESGSEADAAYIAAMHPAVAKTLVAEVRRLRAALDRTRALAFLHAADFLRDGYFQKGLSVQEIGTALRHTADEADPMVGSLARDGFGLDEIADMLSRPVVSAVVETGEAGA